MEVFLEPHLMRLSFYREEFSKEENSSAKPWKTAYALRVYTFIIDKDILRISL